MTNSELVQEFRRLAIAQDWAILGRNNAKYNRLFKTMKEVTEELKARPNDARRELAALYTDTNMQARLMAAKKTLAILPQQARSVIEEIGRANWMGQSFDARMCLSLLDDGTFKPK